MVKKDPSTSLPLFKFIVLLARSIISASILSYFFPEGLSKSFLGFFLGVNVLTENPKDKVPQEVWENKDKRMVRMNSLSHAVEIFKLSKENKTVEGEGYETIIECVKTIAEQLETWIYNGTTKEGDPEVSCFEE